MAWFDQQWNTLDERDSALDVQRAQEAESSLAADIGTTEKVADDVHHHMPFAFGQCAGTGRALPPLKPGTRQLLTWLTVLFGNDWSHPFQNSKDSCQHTKNKSQRVNRHAQPFGLTCLISQKFVSDVAAANPASD